MLLMILLGFLQTVGPSDSSMVLESKSQAQYYISNIEAGNNTEENLWALITLATEHAELKKYIEDEIQRGDYSNESLLLFKKIEDNYSDQLEKVVFGTGSPTLLIDLLLVTTNQSERKKIFRRFSTKFSLDKIDGTDFQSLCQSIIQKNHISDDILTSESFLLPHFFLLYRNSDELIPDNYLASLIENWSTVNISENSLPSSLFRASYLRTLYLKYEYGEISFLYNTLIKEEKFPNSNLRLRLYRYLDYSMYRLGYYDRSLKIVRNYTLPLAAFLGKENERISIKQLQGVYLYSIGKIKTAEEIYQEILSEINRKDINLSRSSLYNNLALAYHELGEYDAYLEFQFKALSIAKKQKNYAHHLKILRNLFVYYRETKNQKDALSHLKSALDLAIENNNSSHLGSIYTLFGSFYRKSKNDFNEAHKYYLKATKILDPHNDARQYIKLLNELAANYDNQQKYQLAIQKHNQIIDLTTKEGGVDYIDALINKALVKIKTGSLNDVLQLISNFKSHDLNQLGFSQIIKAKTVEADYLARTGNPQQALDILEPALDQVVVRAKSSADLKSGFWHVEDEYLNAFELAVSILKENGEVGKAVEKLDQLKTINDASLYQNPLVKSSLLNESELTEYKQLTDQLDATRKKLLTASEDRHFELRQTISQLKLKKRQLDRKLIEDVNSDPISVREVQNRLSARELVFHITELNDQYFIAQISRSDVTINTIPLDSDLRDLLSSSVRQVATHKTNLDSLYEISQILELNDFPDHIEQITLIPDSYFYQLPIDILPLQKPTYSYSYGETRYVIENYRTQYLTSLNDFQSTSKTQPVQEKLNYVGYGVSNFDGYNKQSLVPLPFAQTEVSAIANKLTNLPNIQTYINEKSTKSVFSETAPKASMIHLATHSEVSERDPMFSTIYLSKTKSSADSTFNDQVFAYELFELDLNNDMIMLNSCESGSGPYIQGTGVMGMSRALRYAGANSLVLNLWSVNDKLASDFAIHFYDQLNQGKSKAEALQETKKYFLTHKNASPHFWGPYMLIGNTDPIVEPNQNKNLAMAGIFIVYFLLMTGLSYLTQKEIIFRNRNNNAA